MSNHQVTVSSGGGCLGFAALGATIVLVILQLTHVINVPVWIILAPVLAYLGLGVLAGLIVLMVWVTILIFGIIIYLAEQHMDKTERKRNK